MFNTDQLEAESKRLDEKIRALASEIESLVAENQGPDPRKVDTSGVSYAALVSVAEVSASKTSGAERLHQECRRRVL